MPPISVAQTSERGAGFTLVEAALALAVAALFCAAVASAVALLLREHRTAERQREAALWHQTLLARRAVGRPPLDGPPSAGGWKLEIGPDALPTNAAARGLEIYTLTPEERPSLRETLELPAMTP